MLTGKGVKLRKFAQHVRIMYGDEHALSWVTSYEVHNNFIDAGGRYYNSSYVASVIVGALPPHSDQQVGLAGGDLCQF